MMAEMPYTCMVAFVSMVVCKRPVACACIQMAAVCGTPYICFTGSSCSKALCCPHRDEAASADATKRTFVTACITEWPADSPFPIAEVGWHTRLGLS